MLTVGDKQFRNLQEQVLQNQSDIQYLLHEGGSLNEFGIKVVGVVNTYAEIPAASTYTGEYGDAYAVGTKSPYTLYIYTRPTSGQAGNWWFNIGLFPAPSTVPGPTGPTGPQGATGNDGNKWFVVTTLQQYSQALNATKVGDYIVIGEAIVNVPFPRGQVLQVVAASGGHRETERRGNLVGPQGIPGTIGATGPTGPQGNPGATGPKGENGRSFTIKAILTNANQLPTPTKENQPEAYLIGTAAPYDLYVVVGPDDQGEYIWDNVGRVEGVEGPQGPQGEQGIQGAVGPIGPTGPIGPVGPQGEPGVVDYTTAVNEFYKAWNGTSSQGNKMSVNSNSVTYEESMKYEGQPANQELVEIPIGDSDYIIREQKVVVPEDSYGVSTNALTFKLSDKFIQDYITRQETNQLIGNIKTTSFLVVDALPETGEGNIIYLVPNASATEQDAYDEYIWSGTAWEKIGGTAIDLSQYVKKSDAVVNNKLRIWNNGFYFDLEMTRGDGLAYYPRFLYRGRTADGTIETLSYYFPGIQSKYATDNNTLALKSDITTAIQSQEVSITDVPTTATQGTLTEEQLTTLQANDMSFLLFNNEKYYLQDKGHTEGYLTYTHCGFENDTFTLKAITVTISTRGWVLNSKTIA